MKILKKIILLLLLVFVIAQFFGPEKNDGSLESISAFIVETKPSDEVMITLKTACFDCHSNSTRYPWYNNITPVNYWLADHVKHGKGHLNFSEWESYSVKKKDHKLEEVIEMVEKKEMPLPSYTWTHKDAILTEAQTEAMINWAKQTRMGYHLQPKPQ
ncbi:MAG: heme-binding domain-containing protein [Flavobacteriaceae bacterium]|nr:heme-binding domain-containing protein [Bacteroidia bacterium]NNK27979.1 heme-binding domain-containing protein [Flavobacteriaceae bacterium]NNL60369.1 heme-binding domain-containing protein [Flavobacteriaceae bacterium]